MKDSLGSAGGPWEKCRKDGGWMDLRKYAPIINAIGLIVMIVWGVVGNDWGHSWIAVRVSGIITGVIYSMGKQQDKDKKDS